MNPKPSILFLCTGNSIRSQMAAAMFARAAAGAWEVHSAGVSPYRVHPLTVLIMEESGYDLTRERSKGLDEVPVDRLDYVVTLCGHAREVCPGPVRDRPGEHWPVSDPISVAGGEGLRIARFRECKEEIQGRVDDLVRRLREKTKDQPEG